MKANNSIKTGIIRTVWITCRHLPIVRGLLLSGCLIAAGCTATDPAMSLEEAKALTVDIAASEFTPPQRTINDLREILRTDYVVQNCELPSLTYDPERVELVSRSHQYIIAANEGTRAKAIQAFRYGNFPRALDLVKYARDVFPEGYRMGEGTTGMQLARYYAILGERAMAERTYSISRSQFREGKKWSINAYNRWKKWFDSQTWATRGIMAFVDGRYHEAELWLKKALDTTVSDIGVDSAIIRYYQIWAIERQGRLAEAEAEARFLLAYRGLSPNSRAALSFETLARILLSQGRYEDAQWLAQKAVSIYRFKCIPMHLYFPFQANMRLAQALVGQKKWQEALELFETLETSIRGGDEKIYQNKILSNPDWGIALLATNRPAEAVEKLKHTARILAEQFGTESYSAVEAANLRDLAQSRAGGACAGLEQLTSGLMHLATLRKAYGEGAGLSTIREHRLKFLVNAYLLLALDCSGGVELAGETAENLFEIAQIGRGGQVQAAMSASAARAAAGRHDLAKLVRQFQDTENGAGELSRIIAYRISLPSGDVDAGVTRKLQQRLATLRKAATALSEEIERDFPDYARLLGNRQISAAEIRAHLRPGESVLFIRVAEERSYIWALPKQASARLAVIDLNRQEISKMVADLRLAVDPPYGIQTLGDIPTFDIGLAHKLYAAVFNPVKPGWVDASSLIVVADGDLQQLPFSLMVTEPVDLGQDKDQLFSVYRDVPWLARSHAVVMLPSVAALTILRGLPAGAGTRRAFAGFGDPLFSVEQALAAETSAATAEVVNRAVVSTRGLPVRLRSLPQLEGIDSADLALLPRLPDTRDEVRSIAMAMNADLTRDVFTGKAANEAQVKTMDLYGYKVIAFATHGLVPGDLNGLTQPALALSAPDVAGVDGDGLLTMGEILSLKLDADWVVLSACNTAAGAGAGAEAISGLGRAFFYAGARALLVSNWSVETTSARLLTTDIFRRQLENSNLTRAQALRSAMLTLMDGPGYVDGGGRTVYSYAHPIFWAPFTLVGDGGNKQQPEA